MMAVGVHSRILGPRTSAVLAAVLLAIPHAGAQSPAGKPDQPDIEISQKPLETVLEPKDITEEQRTHLNTFTKTFQILNYIHVTKQHLGVKKFESYKPLTNVEARDEIANTPDPKNNRPEERFVGDIANYRLIQKHKAGIIDLFDRSKMYKAVGAGPVQLFGGSDVRFADFSGETVMIQSRGTEVFFDSSNTDAKTRARDAVDELILPAISDFETVMKADGIDWYAIALTYGSRDLKKQKSADQVSETVCVAWKKEDGKSYIAGRLAPVQFLKKCIIVHSERFIASVNILKIEDPTPALPAAK